MGITLDHIVIAAQSLDEGRAWAEAKLGVPPAGGGHHAAMGTHNALWGMGACYLEVIAVDPASMSSRYMISVASVYATPSW